MVFFYALLGFGFGLYGFFKGLSMMKRKRLIENIPTSKIRSIAMGLVEIYGQALPSEKKPIKSPFSGKDCFYYEYKIEEYKSSGKSKGWTKVKEGKEGVPFYLKDKTGKVLVNPMGAKVDIPADNMFESNAGKSPSKTIQSFLSKHGIKHKGWIFEKHLRYSEWFLAPKDKLYILGTARDNPYVKEATAKYSPEDIMIHKGREMYYISDSPEKDIVSNLAIMSKLGIFGGPILSGICLILMFISLITSL